MENQHQSDCYGNHRIKVGNTTGEPALYEHPAFLHKEGRTYIAVTGYYDGEVPIETVFELIPVESEGICEFDRPCNFFRPEDPCTHMEVRQK